MQSNDTFVMSTNVRKIHEDAVSNRKKCQRDCGKKNGGRVYTHLKKPYISLNAILRRHTHSPSNFPFVSRKAE